MKTSIAVWLFVTVVQSLFLFASSSCTDNETGPDTKLIKEFKWEMDTLVFPGSFQTIMKDMWASGSNNVYIVGFTGQTRGQMYCYSGSDWTPVKFSQAEGGTIRIPHNLNAIDGTAPDDVWSVGYRNYRDSTRTRIIDSSFIMHFNGVRWDEYPVHGGRQLLNVWAGSRTNVWATGAEGTVFQFDGTSWIKHDLKRNYFHVNVAGIYTSETQYKVYTIAYRNDYIPPNDSSGYFLFEYDGIGWNVVDSLLNNSGVPAHFGYGLWSDKKQLYSMSGDGIFIFTGHGWSKVTNIPAGHMYKSSPENIFAVGERVYRFNGLQWKEYSQFYSGLSMRWYDCYADSNQVFILGSDGYKTIILHGK